MTTKPRAKIGKVNVWCAFDEIVKVESVKMNPMNPNTHPPAQIERLAKIITAQGWRNAIAISNRSGMIVKGHGRFKAAVHAGMRSVPVEYQDYESDESETADLLADNIIAELAVFDQSIADELLKALDAADFDLELTGMGMEIFDDGKLQNDLPKKPGLELAKQIREAVEYLGGLEYLSKTRPWIFDFSRLNPLKGYDK
uniref:ParB-like N-terminal domain-containing protein n=1 Tax=viral metagenome TaxID=1070528 RepID=A0A6M3J2B0_9ZZZZ